MIAGKNAESAGVIWQGIVNAVFRAEVGEPSRSPRFGVQAKILILLFCKSLQTLDIARVRSLLI